MTHAIEFKTPLFLIRFYASFWVRTIVLLIIGITLSMPGYAQKSTDSLFSHLSTTLFQIRIVDKSTGQKSSIGSGFQVSSDGLIATNYHVVSEQALDPENFIIEYEDSEGSIGALTLLRVDVINDLALLKRQNSSSAVNLPFLSIATEEPKQGVKVYSLGNPHDLGMIISPGTYNGIKENSFYQRIHFTGSVNSGMSGGPAVNEAEQVVGINVASGGNSIGFLVHRDALTALIAANANASSLGADKVEATEPGLELYASIQQQIKQSLEINQKRLFTELLSKPWRTQRLGEVLVPIDLIDAVKCWDNSNTSNKDALIKAASVTCRMEENIYLSNDFRSGTLSVDYNWYSANEINATRFYNLYQNYFNSSSARYMSGNKEDVHPFICNDDVVINNHNNITNQTGFCARAYKNYQGLYDVVYISAMLDKHNNGLISTFKLLGVDKQNALAFSNKFIDTINWIP